MEENNTLYICVIGRQVEKLKIQKQNDSIKDKYTIDNNIKLLRIRYNQFKNIEKILRIELLNGLENE